MRVARCLVGAVFLACAVSGWAVGASGGPGGMIRLWLTPGSGAVSKIVITGAIGDYGTATSIDKNGKADVNGDYVRISLKRGSFEINATAFNQKLNTSPPASLNKKTCSVYFAGSGQVTLFGGRGAYAGISGAVEVNEALAAIGPRYRTGTRRGQCDLNSSASPVAQWGAITGSGIVTF